MKASYCTETNNPCENEQCQKCCEHDKHEDFICLGCGKEGDPSDWYGEDFGEDR